MMGGQNNLITVSVRDVTRNNGPHRRIVIRNNTFIASGAGHQKAIYAITTSGTRQNHTPCEDLLIEDNQFVCPAENDYFGANVVVHGFAAGYHRVQLRRNRFAGAPGASPNYTPGGVSGLVILMSDHGYAVEDVLIDANIFVYRRPEGTRIGVNIQPDVTRVVLTANEFPRAGRAILVDPRSTGEIDMQELPQ
jgi:hypothetical protein